MRYIMKQKLISLGSDFNIKDELGNDVFFVDGKAFTIGKKLSFQDMDGNELAFIKQKLVSWGPTYEISLHGSPYATVKKELFTFFHDKFTVDVPGPNDLEVKGDFLDFEYEFTRQGEVVASVSKEYFSVTDTYGVDINDDEDEILILVTTVVIDMVSHRGRND